MRIRIDIMYDGTGFHGWQIQPGKSSVQGEITAAARRLFGEDISLLGSGRTDAGVHALGQVAHFDISKDFEIKKVVSGLNFYLPLTIRVVNASVVPDSFSAMHDAKNKTYHYLMYDAPMDNPLLLGRAHRVHGLDYAEMEKAAVLVKGRFDFSPFMSSGSSVKTTVRTITDSVFCRCNSLFGGGQNSEQNSGENSGFGAQNTSAKNQNSEYCGEENSSCEGAQNKQTANHCEQNSTSHKEYDQKGEENNGLGCLQNRQTANHHKEQNSTLIREYDSQNGYQFPRQGVEQNRKSALQTDNQGYFYVYKVSANGFLYNMVRKIVGVLLAIGEGKRPAEDIARILAAGERVNEIAPPQGLYLYKVDY